MREAPKKVVLAYSGGLDTSVILRWLQETYGCEVVTFTADIGQGEELEPARAKAETLGVRDIRAVSTCTSCDSRLHSSRRDGGGLLCSLMAVLLLPYAPRGAAAA